jgi:hypothetical protein
VDSHDMALGVWEKAPARSGRRGELSHGHNAGAEAREGAERDGVA